MRHLPVLAVMLALLPGIASACECPDLPPDQVVREATLAFAGQTAMPRNVVVPAGGASFQNVQIWKGVRLVTPIVAGNRPGGEASCAADFFLSQTYSVLAYGSYETGYSTDKCALSRLNGNGEAQRKVQAYLANHYFRIEAGMQAIGAGSMQDLVWVRRVAKLYLDEHSAEQARRFYSHAATLSRNSVVDLQGEGDAYLQLGLAREALTRFDDVLEKDNKQQAAWNGRYKALALMDRWSELPPEKADLTGFIWKRAELTADLGAPVFAGAWWMQVKAEGRKLIGADFSRAELSAVSFGGSDLTGANFAGARLFNVDFTGATLKDAIFTGVNYEQVKWPEGFTPPASTPLPSVGQENAAGR